MLLDNSQIYFLKGYICNINFDHELHGAEMALRMIGVKSSQIDELFSAKLAELKERKHYRKGNKKCSAKNFKKD